MGYPQIRSRVLEGWEEAGLSVPEYSSLRGAVAGAVQPPLGYLAQL